MPYLCHENHTRSDLANFVASNSFPPPNCWSPGRVPDLLWAARQPHPVARGELCARAAHGTHAAGAALCERWPLIWSIHILWHAPRSPFRAARTLRLMPRLPALVAAPFARFRGPWCPASRTKHLAISSTHRLGLSRGTRSRCAGPSLLRLQGIAIPPLLIQQGV